jgi:hypothetical protein
MNVVWILGSGFSRPLGGPLLHDLISAKMGQDLSFYYQGPEYAALRTAVESIGSLYGVGLKREQWNRPWQNPEEFIAYLDETEPDIQIPDNRMRLERLIRCTDAALIGNAAELQKNAAATLPVWKSSAKRAIAAACSYFVHEADKTTEAWEPYRTWAQQITARDTIITFNYDRVPDCLSDQFEIPLPDDAAEIASHDNAPMVLKMHGSVNWVEGQGRLQEGDVEKILKEPRAAIAIAIPGRSKQSMVEQSLSALWDLAKSRLQAADVVVFVGYRFPATDNKAKELLHAIGRRSNPKPLTIRTVLGPETRGEDVQRLDGMLRWVLGSHALLDAVGIRTDLMAGNDHEDIPHRATIVVEPMWAQDFLAVFDRPRLNAWHSYNQTMRTHCNE